MQQVVFRLLGPPELSYNDQSIRILRRRARALLYYMVSTHAPQPRERLLALLCGEMDEEHARHAFKTLLAEARGLLRSFDSTINWIIGDGDLLTFNPLAPTWLDTEVFEKDAVATSRGLNQAIKLYRGDFLDGFFLKDSPGFDYWVQSTRDHYRHLYLSALRRLASMNESDNQLEQAITCMNMILTVDPLSEDAYARLMRLYWMAGDRTESLRQYERLRSMLAKELSVIPSAATQSLYEQIVRSSKWPPVSKSFSSTPSEQPDQESFPPRSHQLAHAAGGPGGASFVGRSKEFEWLKDHLLGPANDQPLLIIRGEAGSGKTRFVQEAVRRFCSSWIILQGACQEVERGHPYHALIEALSQGLTREQITQLNLAPAWLAQIALLIPDLIAIEEPERATPLIEPTIVAQALIALFNQLARPQRPLLFVLDDLHWADKSTLTLLGHLSRYAWRGSVFLLGTVQGGMAEKRLAPLLRSAQRSQALAQLTISPLTPAEAVELAAAFGSQYNLPSEQLLDSQLLGDWCYQRSEGNPLLAVEWLSYAVKELAAGQGIYSIKFPGTLQTLIESQLSSLSRSASTLLSAAACRGTSFHLLEAMALINFDTRTTLDACDELIKRGLIVETPSDSHDYYTFTHRIVREVIFDTMSSAKRLLLQQALGT